MKMLEVRIVEYEGAWVILKSQHTTEVRIVTRSIEFKCFSGVVLARRRTQICVYFEQALSECYQVTFRKHLCNFRRSGRMFTQQSFRTCVKPHCAFFDARNCPWLHSRCLQYLLSRSHNRLLLFQFTIKLYSAGKKHS